ncbi:MAG: PAS domain S-box protein [Inquilinus sp.]|nr:PAS domain S-box protein [Inquilinus sp.]
MLSRREADTPSVETADAGEVRAAQMSAFARQTPNNSLVTLAAAILTAAILQRQAPTAWVLCWAAPHVVIALYLLYRWWKRRGTLPPKSVSHRGPRRAKYLAWISGALWGAGALFLTSVPTTQQLALIIVIGAMAGGASTTLAAVPAAARGFILLSILPVAAFFVSQNELTYFGLAALALVMALSMLRSTQIAYRSLLEEIRAQQRNALLLSQFHAERREWTDISDTADAFALFDKDNRLLLWNESFGRLFALAPETLYRGNRRRTLLRRGATPVEVAHGERSMKSWIDEQLSLESHPDAPVIAHLSNGRWIRSHARRTDGQQTATIHVDITEVKEAEQRAQQLATIVESTDDAIVGIDLDGAITSWNAGAEQCFGYAAAEVIGQPLSMLPPADRLDDVPLIVSTAERGEHLRNYETVRRHKSGRLIDVSLTASPVRDAAGEVVGIAAIYRDISEQKRTKEQLRQAQKMEAVGQLTGGVAHDFNTLLGVILGNLELLEDRGRSYSEQDQLITSAAKAAAKGVDLTSRLLAFSRKQTLRPEVTDLNQRMTEAITLLDRTLCKTVEIKTEPADGLWRTAIDSTQMETAIINLAANARDAMPNGGTLTIRTENRVIEAKQAERLDLEPGRYVTLSLADTGTGMPPDVLEQVFEPFFTTRDVGEGSGLGLSMVYGFVKQSGGAIEMSSEVGVGTTVTLWFPRTTRTAPMAGDRRSPPPPSGTGETILVVEDDPSLQRVAHTMLTSLGYRVLTASNGKDALKALGEDPEISLMFTDLALPHGMNGATLAKQAAARHPALKVLYTSGFADYAGIRYEALDEDTPLIAKPYRKAVLAQQVRELLGDGAG